MHSDLSDHQVKIDCYIQKLLYKNFTGTTSQKPTIHPQKLKRKEYKHNKKSHQITSEERKRRKKE